MSKCKNCGDRIILAFDECYYHTSFNEMGEFLVRDSDVNCKAELRK